MVQRGAKYERHGREHYATPAWVTEIAIRYFDFSRTMWDPACGDGAMTRVFAKTGRTALASDIHPIGLPDAVTLDFLADPNPFPWTTDIVTNPPYGVGGRLGVSFVERALEITRPWGGRVAMLLPVDFDSASTRRHIFGDHPAFAKKVILLRRIVWVEPPPGEKRASPSANHAWFFWSWSKGPGAPTLNYGG